MSYSVAPSKPKGKNHGCLEQLFSHADDALNRQYRLYFRVLPVAYIAKTLKPGTIGLLIMLSPDCFPVRQTFKLGKNICAGRTMP